MTIASNMSLRPILDSNIKTWTYTVNEELTDKNSIEKVHSKVTHICYVCSELSTSGSLIVKPLDPKNIDSLKSYKSIKNQNLILAIHQTAKGIIVSMHKNFKSLELKQNFQLKILNPNNKIEYSTQITAPIIFKEDDTYAMLANSYGRYFFACKELLSKKV